MWPDGVATQEDVYSFCEMIVGKSGMQFLSDYRKRMPIEARDCHLVFIRGGCGDGTKLIGLKDCIPDLMDELRARARAAGNWATADIAVSVGHSTSEFCYDSAQLCKSRCTCRIELGGGGRGRTSSRYQPVDCQVLVAGRQFETVLMAAFTEHQRSDDIANVAYFDKAFHVLLHTIDHRKNHRLGFHTDRLSSSYVPDDPISFMSWGRTGVLVLRAAREHRLEPDTHIIVVMHGDIVIMAGRFQELFEHSVPPVRDWADLLEKHRSQLAQWEIEAMQVEIDAIQNGFSCPLFRHSITLAWLNSHTSSCHW
jgi:hypothetical protein